jgi:uncharacterized protein YciI
MRLGARVKARELTMFVIFLTFAENRSEAGRLMEAHKAWIGEGITAGVFQLVGSLTGGAGGAILAHGESREDVEARIASDPFVIQGVVAAHIHEFSPSLAGASMQHFLA